MVPDPLQGKLLSRFEMIPLEKWEDLQDHVRQNAQRYQRWFFRGEKDASWLPKPSLERALSMRFPSAWSSAAWWEERLLREFKRHVHRHLHRVPAEQALDEWWALMQHYGGPTRLLDWTYSVWVACFFALEKSRPCEEGDGNAVSVWTIDADWLWTRFREMVSDEQKRRLLGAPRSPSVLYDVLVGNPITGVKALNPFYFNTRLAAQQGVFLAPCNVAVSFAENLLKTIDFTDSKTHCVKLNLSFDEMELGAALRDLNRMNVSRATLFPGLQGLAEHLENLIAAPERFEGIRSNDDAGP